MATNTSKMSNTRKMSSPTPFLTEDQKVLGFLAASGSGASGGASVASRCCESQSALALARGSSLSMICMIIDSRNRTLQPKTNIFGYRADIGPFLTDVK